MAPYNDRDHDYRIYCTSPEDPRLVFKSEIAANALVIRRNGFVGIGWPIPGSELDVNGTATMTVCRITSDRAMKERFEPVKPSDVLAKLASLPISTWVYTNAPRIRHIGPVAQDFAAAFAVGEDDKHIATVDADGVAFAAIQGLHQLVQEKDARIQNLENRLNAVERLLESRFAAQKRP
jgi:Chaperone of endosialidase